MSADHQPRLTDLLSSQTGKVRKIVWVGIGLASFQQLVGINVVFYYGAVLWQAVGFSESDALLINVISGGLSIAACVITLLIIDKVGRKPLLQWGSVGMAITLGLMVLCFANAGQDENGNLLLGDWGKVALISANAYVFFFNLSWGACDVGDVGAKCSQSNSWIFGPCRQRLSPVELQLPDHHDLPLVAGRLIYWLELMAFIPGRCAFYPLCDPNGT